MTRRALKCNAFEEMIIILDTREMLPATEIQREWETKETFVVEKCRLQKCNIGSCVFNCCFEVWRFPAEFSFCSFSHFRFIWVAFGILFVSHLKYAARKLWKTKKKKKKTRQKFRVQHQQNIFSSIKIIPNELLLACIRFGYEFNSASEAKKNERRAKPAEVGEKQISHNLQLQLLHCEYQWCSIWRQ